MKYGSRLVEEAVESFACLPGIGRKTALRLVLHLLRGDESLSRDIAESILRAKKEIKRCDECCNISDETICSVCKSPHRNRKLLCIVESIRDVMAIEETGQFNGLFHVLGGVISPIEGISPADLYIERLVERLKEGEIEEVIFAISPTIDGETTSFYLFKLLEPYNLSISQLSRGISFGGELEYADEITLGRSILSRLPYESKARRI